jgi:hypothetical protein
MWKLERELAETIALADSIGVGRSDSIRALLFIARAINLSNLANLERDAPTEKTTGSRASQTDLPTPSKGFTTDPSH